mmetsp:Transcript_14088/g.34442  ORF Transcript_14088/g.34442 Transcript_14088/m.34442 type:complete len:641 (+) Transcript_14088:84-2006(+)
MAQAARHVPSPSISGPQQVPQHTDKGDRIDELIEDGDKALKGLPSKLTQLPGPDPKALKDAFLETSPAFQEMLQSLETHDASAVSGGPPPSKYDQAFFSALRTMLRECLFTKNSGLKKHHIDRVYSWYKEKQQRSGSLTGRDRDKRELSTPSRPSFGAQRPYTAPSARDKPRDGARRVQYLSKLRGGDYDSTLPQDSPLGPEAAEAPAHGDLEMRGVGAQKATLPASVRIKEFKMRNLRVSQMRRSGIPAEAIKAADIAQREALRASSAMEARSDDRALASEKTDRAIKELWLRKRQEEEMERQSEMEVQEAMAWWASNRARIEEEISRRQESIRFASQTARLHSRPASAYTVRSGGGVSEARARANAQALMEDLQSGFTSSEKDDEEEDDVEVIEDMMANPPLPDKFQKIPQMRAPYDGLRTSNTTAGWALASPNRPISARLAGYTSGATHNFGSRPVSAARIRARPQTAGARVDVGTIQVASYDEGRSLVHVKPEGELHGFTSPHSSRPVSAYRASAATTVLHSPASTPAETPRVKGGGSLGPSRPGSASSSRHIQLGEIDRIKRAFARSKIVCTMNVLERALVVPEDRTYAKCVEALPKAGFNLVPDPILLEKKLRDKKAKGKKGKKGGKGGKKKKK